MVDGKNTVLKGGKKGVKTPGLKELKEVKKEAEKEIAEVKHAIEIEKKELKKETVDAKKEVKTLQVENSELKNLIIDVIRTQDKTRWTEYLNILCWVVCFVLFALQSIKG